MAASSETIVDYIASLPPDARPVVERICQIVRTAAPAAEEKISYGMPTFTLAGRPLIYVAGWKQHVSLHAVPPLQSLESELRRYRSGKDTVRFPLDEPVPYHLIQTLIGDLARSLTP